MIGTQFRLQTSNAPTNSTAAVMSLGISKTNLGPFQLPLSLAPFGMPGCWLYHSYDVQWVFSMKNGSGTFSLSIPRDRKLIGSRTHLQAMVLSPNANAAQLLSSNAGTMLIGTR